MATDPSTFGLTLGPESKHGFFKTLPRELRDGIYDLTYQKVETEYSGSYLCASIPVVKLRLVSRQFKAEYDDRCSQNEQLGRILFKGAMTQALDGGSGNDIFVKFPTHAARATDMTAILRARDIAQKSNLYHWLCEVAAQLPCLDRIKVYLEDPNCSLSYSSILCLAEVTRNPEVIRIELLQPGQPFVGDVDRETHVTWTTENGIERVEEVAQQCHGRMLDNVTVSLYNSVSLYITIAGSSPGNMA